MQRVSESPSIVSTEIGGRLSTGTEANLRTCVFGDVARVIWREKVDAKIATIAKCSPRAAREYLNGNVPAPAIVIAAMLVEITRRS